MTEVRPQVGPACMRRWGWLIVVASVLVVYWPLSTFGHGMDVNDAKNCWMPWRWLVASALQDGQFPTWAPYHQFGYPIHADLQGPAWYLEAIALGGTLGHDAYTLQVLYLAYLCIGGVGMQRVALRVQDDPTIAVVIGVAYALGGFFTGQQMHFYTVISAAWLPWFFHAVLDLLQVPGWRPAVRVAAFQALLLSGGNHTFTIISAYVCAILALVQCVRLVGQGDIRGLKRMLGHGVLAVALVLPMAAGTLLAAVEVVPLMSRTEGLSLEQAGHGAITWSAWRSIWMPYAVGTDPQVLGTDGPMANGYMGVIITAFAVLALVRRRSAVENTLLVIGGICFLVSLGPALPVHGLLWEYAPGMGRFRFPAYYRWFIWFSVLYSAAVSMHAWRTDGLSTRQVRVALLCMLLIGFALVPTFTMDAQGGTDAGGLYGRMTGMPLRGRAWLALPGLVLPIGLLCVAAGRRKFPALLLLGAVVLEMGWNTTLAQWNTAVSPLRPALITGRTAPLTKGPIVPEGLPLRHFKDDGTELHYLMYNSQDFLGHPVHGGYNSFWVANSFGLERDHTSLWRAMDRQPLVYFADSVSDGLAAVDEVRDSGLVVVPGQFVAEVPTVRTYPAKATITGFDMRSIEVSCVTDGAALLVLQQSAYPGWSVTVDGHSAPLVPANLAAMGVVVPEGRHLVEFRFARKWIPWALWIGLVAQLGAWLLLALTGPFRSVGLFGVLFLSGTVCWSLLAHTPKAEALPRDVGALLERLKGSPVLYLNTDRSMPGADGAHRLRAEAPDRMVDLPLGPWSQEGWWVDAGLATHRSIRAHILDKAEVVERVWYGRAEAVRLRPRTGAPPGQVLAQWASLGPRTMDATAPFSEGFEVDLAALQDGPDDELVVDFEYQGEPTADLVIVLDVKMGDTSVDYRTYPVQPVRVRGDRATFHAVCAVRELRRPGARLVVYPWLRGGGAVAVEGFRLRMSSRGLSYW